MRSAAATSRLRRSGPALVALAAFCWGLAGGIGGLLIDIGWDALLVSFYRGAVGFLLVALWLVFRPQGSGLGNPRLWLWSVVAGIGIAGNFSFYFLSIAEGNVPVAATLMYCAPVFVYIISFALGLEHSTPRKWVEITIVMLGVVLLTGVFAPGSADVTSFAIATGLLSGLSYAVFIFGFKYASSHGSPPAILVIAFAALVTVVSLYGGAEQAVAVLYTPSWLLFLVLGVLGGGLSFTLYIIGLTYTAPTSASLVAMVEPVTAALFGVLVLGGSLTGVQVIGMLLVLITVTAMSVRR